MNRIDEVIHKELLPIRQMFISYEQLTYNPSIHIDPKIFRKCAIKIEEVITIARGLAVKEALDDKVNSIS